MSDLAGLDSKLRTRNEETVRRWADLIQNPKSPRFKSNTKGNGIACQDHSEAMMLCHELVENSTSVDFFRISCGIILEQEIGYRPVKTRFGHYSGNISVLRMRFAFDFGTGAKWKSAKGVKCRTHHHTPFVFSVI